MDRIRIGLLGCGTVGTGVLRILRDQGAEIAARLGAELEVAAIVVRDASKPRDPAVPTALLTEDPTAVLEADDIPIVVEVVGGYEPPRTLILDALARGKHVVTANKALLARHGREIFQAADDAGRDVVFEAAVGGGIPIIRLLREGLVAERVDRIRAIINGTSNFVLTSMARDGLGYDEAVSEAQRLGYAEADPTMDVGGFDAAQKLSILIALSYGAQLAYDGFLIEGIDRLDAADVAYAEGFGYVVKPLAIAQAHEAGIEARVHPALVRQESLLASVDGAFNAVHVDSSSLGPMLVYGQGAGMLPTASAVVADVVECARNLRRGSSGRRLPHLAFHPELVAERSQLPNEDVRCPWYLRFTVRDEAGVLATLADILSHQRISVSRMLQESHVVGGDSASADSRLVHVVMLTHSAREGDVQRALRAIEHLPFVAGPSRWLRVEEPDG